MKRNTRLRTAGAGLMLGVAAAAPALSAAVPTDMAGDIAAARPDRYLDGTYTARGQYGNQPSFIIVTLRLQHDLITAARVLPQAYVPESLTLQRRFAAALPGVVVGRSLDEVHIDKLAGSSGTPKGFNDAVRQIRQQALRHRRP